MEENDKIYLELSKNEMTQSERLESLYDINFAHIDNELKHIPELHEIVRQKVERAKENHLLFHIFLPVKIELKKLSKADLCHAAEALLDNAFEAAAESEQKLIEMTVAKVKEMYCISILNSCNNIVDVSDVFSIGYTTKENHAGRGLNNVLEVIRKYPQGKSSNMSLEVEYKDNIFSAVFCFK